MKKCFKTLLTLMVVFSTWASSPITLYYRSKYINDGHEVKVTRNDDQQRIEVNSDDTKFFIKESSDIKRFFDLKIVRYKSINYAFITWDKGAHSKVISIHNLKTKKTEKEIISHMDIEVIYQHNKAIITYDKSIKPGTLEGEKAQYIFTP